VLLFTVNSFRTLFYEVLEKLIPDDLMAQRAIADHQKILDAIANHDPEHAQQLMRDHLSYFEKRARKIEHIK
jgi:DNA-binding FadR family transcriptional regulator